MIIDDAVRATITRSGLDRTLFVEAGAGTGKTRALVERIANLVVDRGVRLVNIAAITFTEAAAAELRQRIRVEIEQRLMATDDPEAERRCEVALADADQAAISTLHGFAQRVLSEHPLPSGLPPRIGVLDEVSSQLEREARWERFVDELHDDPAHDELLMRAALVKIRFESRSEGTPTLRHITLCLADSWDRLQPVATRQHGSMAPIDFGPFDTAVADVQALLTQCTDHDDRLYSLIVTDLLPNLLATVELDAPHLKLREMSAVQAKTGNVGSAKAWPGGAQEARAVVRAVEAAAGDVVEAVCDDVLNRLITLIAAELVGAAEDRRVHGRLEFHDLLVFAEQLLERSESARRRLHERYTHLLLDEFQDTDPLQIRLAVLIASAIDGEPTPRWQDIDVGEGRLFFVGDPKQSIYRFRRADIALFLDARDRFGGGDALQQLTTNFRTVGPVIDWVNGVFEQLMADEIPGKQPRYEPLHAHRAPRDGHDHRPVLLGGPSDAAYVSELRAAEAADVGDVIEAIRSHPERWPVDDGGQWRPARLSDITVLIPTRTELPALRMALRERGVPFHLSTGTLVYETQEVRDALAVLAAIDDPSDELSLVAALRSALYACSDVDLFTFHAAGGRWNLRSDPPLDLQPDHPVVAAMVHLRMLWEQRWWHQPSVLLARLLQDRNAAVIGFGSERPAEAWSRLHFLLDQARSFEASSGGGIRAFLRWTELQRSETATIHEPVAFDDTDDVVRVMTIHGAKGLEFPITILSGLAAERPTGVRGPSVLWGDDGMPCIALSASLATSGHGHLAGEEADMGRHEQTRLLYVAATRARDHLIVSTHHRPGKASFAEQFWESSRASSATWRRFDTPGGSPQAVQASAVPSALAADASSRDIWRSHRQALLDGQRRSRYVSATEVARTASSVELAADDDDHTDEIDHSDTTASRSTEAPIVHRRGRAGTSIGRAVHATLQMLDLANPTNIGTEAARRAELEGIPELAGLVESMVQSALGSEALGLAASHPHHTEVYVAAPVGDRVLEGYVDLLIETPEGLVVVDYKTDSVSSEAEVDAKLAAYELQGAAYAVALRVTTGLPVADCRFVFCRPGGAIERTVADLPLAMDRVSVTLALDA